VLCAGPAEAAVTTMVEDYLSLKPAPGLIMFRIRLGLAVIDLAGGAEQSAAARAVIRLLDEAAAAKDRYVAREILSHDRCRTQLTHDQERKLSTALRTSGLGGQMVPGELMAAVTLSETATAGHLNAVQADL
jgi:hypothetical protein